MTRSPIEIPVPSDSLLPWDVGISHLTRDEFQRVIVEYLESIRGPEVRFTKIRRRHRIRGRRSGKEREFDLSVAMYTCGAKFLVPVDCLLRKSSVSVNSVEKFAQRVNDVDQLFGMIFTSSRFSPAAVKRASTGAIMLFRVVPSQVKPSILVFSSITEDFVRLLNEKPDLLCALKPEKFEELIAERIQQMGYDVTLTGSATTKDGGVDLIAVPRVRGPGTVLIAGQIKHHEAGHKTGVEAVDRLLAWKGNPFHLGLLVTNTSFTSDAIWKATQPFTGNFVRLRDFTDIRRWLANSFSDPAEYRDLPDDVSLRPGLTVRIPRSHPVRALTIQDGIQDR